MKIISWNVNGIRAIGNKGFLPFVERERPDLLCLQETKAHIDQVEVSIREPVGMTGCWSSAIRKGYSGVASFARSESRFPVREWIPRIGDPRYDSEGRVVISDHGEFLVYNIYFPNGASGAERHGFKQEFLKYLNSHLSEKISSGREVIVVGDYNVAHRDIDVYDPVKLQKESGFLPEEKAWFDSFLGLGFVDTFRHFRPTETGAYTWWSYVERARPVNRGWRIDYICVTNGLLSRVRAARIMDEIEGSDHCPVAIELE